MNVIRAETSRACDITRGSRPRNEEPRAEVVAMRATRVLHELTIRRRYAREES